MFGLSEDFPYAALIGQGLIQVCIGENELIMHFEAEISLNTSSSVAIVENGKAFRTEDYVHNANLFCGFLGHKITNALSNNTRDLTLHFDNDKSVTILDDCEDYESYVVKIGDRSYVI